MPLTLILKFSPITFCTFLHCDNTGLKQKSELHKSVLCGSLSRLLWSWAWAFPIAIRRIDRYLARYVINCKASDSCGWITVMWHFLWRHEKYLFQMGYQQQSKNNFAKSILVNQWGYWCHLQDHYDSKAAVASKNLRARIHWSYYTPSIFLSCWKSPSSPPKMFMAFIILGKGPRYHLRFVYFMNLLSLLLTPRRGMFHFGGNSYITMSETSHSDINSAHGSSQQLWCLLSVMSLA